MSEEPIVKYEKRDRIAIITLNRPDRMNALNQQMRNELAQSMAMAANDSDVRVIVVTGAGRAFSAGADVGGLKDRASGNSSVAVAKLDDAEYMASIALDLGPDHGEEFSKILHFAYMIRIGKPIIAAINGAVAGASCVLALCADIRFASDKMLFTSAFSQRGLVAEHGIQWLLTRLLGTARTLDLLFTSRRVGAVEAKELGLVNDVFPSDSFMESVLNYARGLADNVSPRSMAVIKAQVWKSLSQSYNEALEVSNAEIQRAFETPDFKEGVAHLLEKRPANFPPLKR